MASFDHLMRANQIHGIGGQAVVLHQRVALDDRFDVFGGLGLEGATISARSFTLPSTKMVQAAAPMTQSRLFETRSSQAR